MIWLTHTFHAILATLVLLHAVPGDITEDTAGGQDAARTAASADQTATQSMNVDDVDPAVVALLDELEKSHKQLQGFTARVRYDKVDATLGTSETRLGEVIYIADLNTGADNVPIGSGKRFAVLFDTLVKGRRRRERLEHYVFDGRWLAEINHADRQFIKREVVPPGETLDPLKLGEGPFPMPIGQSRAEVLQRFTVVPASVPTSGPLATLDPASVDGLTLTPRAGTPQAEEFTQVTIFYDHLTRLPIGVITQETNSNTRTVRLSDIVRDPPVDDAIRAKISIETPPKEGWHIDIQAWK